MRTPVLLYAVLIAASARPAAAAAGRLGLLLGFGSAENAHQYGERLTCRDTDLECGAVYRSGARWYAEAVAGWRASDLDARNTGDDAPPLDGGHMRLTAGYRADTFNRTELNLVAGLELATERWYDDSLYVHTLSKPARGSGITAVAVGAPYEITYAYSVLIPKLFVGIEPNIALNNNLRAVVRYGFELRFLPAERRMTFTAADNSLDDDDIAGTLLDNARKELGNKLSVNLQYMF